MDALKKYFLIKIGLCYVSTRVYLQFSNYLRLQESCRVLALRLESSQDGIAGKGIGQPRILFSRIGALDPRGLDSDRDCCCVFKVIFVRSRFHAILKP